MAPQPLSLDPHAGSTPLANQVAGHQNVLSDASGSLVIKPALPREIAFYHLLNSASRRDPVSALKPFVPQFYGTLRLEGKLDGAGQLSPAAMGNAAEVPEVPESVVLGNLAHEYTRPSILDVKLGRVLAAPDATEEKKARMDTAARSTTSWETGMRFTGCQTWHAPTQSYILTPKTYGKSITPAELPDALARFFPLPTDSIPAIIAPPTPTSSTTTTSPTSAAAPHLPLPPGAPPATVAPVAPVAAVAPATPTSGKPAPEYTSHAIQPKALLRVLSLIDDQLEQLQTVLTTLEARFVGSSILIVYEGEPERLENALDRWEARQAQRASLAAEGLGGAAGDDEDEEEGLFEDDEGDEDGSTSSDDDEDDGARADARRARRCPPVSVRMIDFAHTMLVEGEGPDEGVLKGLDTLRGLVKGRAERVRQAVYEGESSKGGAGA